MWITSGKVNHLSNGPDRNWSAGVCDLTTPWLVRIFVVPPGTADEGEDDEGDEAGAAGEIVPSSLRLPLDGTKGFQGTMGRRGRSFVPGSTSCDPWHWDDHETFESNVCVRRFVLSDWTLATA